MLYSTGELLKKKKEKFGDLVLLSLSLMTDPHGGYMC